MTLKMCQHFIFGVEHLITNPAWYISDHHFSSFVVLLAMLLLLLRGFSIVIGGSGGGVVGSRCLCLLVDEKFVHSVLLQLLDTTLYVT